MTDKVVLIVALGDMYWTSFADFLAEQLARRGIRSVIAMESRVGEYQTFLGRHRYAADKMYYLTDYARSLEAGLPTRVASSVVMGDYLRMRMLGQDRRAMQTNWAKVGSVLTDFARHVFENESIGVVVSDQVSTALGYAFCQEAEERCIQYFGLSGSRLPGRYVIARSVRSEASRVKEIYEAIVNGASPMTEAELAWACDYLAHVDRYVPDYMRSPRLNSISLKKFMNRRYLRNVVGSILYELMERTDRRNIYLKAPPLRGVTNAMLRNVMRPIRAASARRFFLRNPLEAVQAEDYFVFPIHYQPEASTVIGSPFYSDQENVITNLAFSLPPGVKLIVKEHVSNVGFMRKQFYRRLSALPNVVLAHQEVNIKELIRGSRGVVTLTSTAGFEALLLDKPVFYFGDVFYTFHPLAVRLGDWASATQLLRDERARLSYDNRAFIVAYRRYTAEGRLNFDDRDFGITDDICSRIMTALATDPAEVSHGSSSLARMG
jgi:hypothetical protein